MTEGRSQKVEGGRTESTVQSPQSAVARGDGVDDDLSVAELQGLFVAMCRALAFDALRMKPREKQFAILLGSESFGEGSAYGWIDIGAWRLRLPAWRSNEVKAMFECWRRAGWLVVDVTEQAFRLAPDQFPGWANVQAIQRSEVRQRPLSLRTEDDLHKTFAKISQANAVRGAKISQPIAPAAPLVAKFSHPGEPTEGNVLTFKRLTSERLNVERCTDGIAKISQPAAAYGGASAKAAVRLPNEERTEALKAAVREFVGEADWTAKGFWNCGMGWRGRLFVEEYAQLEGALAYCRAALTDRESAVRIKKTPGAMLWNEFQRLRAERMRA